MGKIKKLPPEIAQQVAAGEVVERPANIVKELLENSLDAGANVITLWIEDGGKQLIRIQDNGCGMPPDDAQLCFAAHATSKITSVDELQTVSTYGFRGEALASISSVACITLKTKEQNAKEGFFVLIESGSITDTGVTACSVGTDINIKDLFHHIPARKKFLKKAATEIRHVQQLFYANCFQFLNVHFTLFNEGRALYNCPPVKTLSERWSQLHGHEQSSSMLELQKHTYQNITIKGIISNHQVAKYDRNHMYLFVNRRWVKNQPLVRALIRGYQNVLPPGKYPTAIINITIDPLEVDSNIHPRKEEVKFLHPRRVEQQLQQAVKTTLETNVSKQISQPVQFTSFVKHEYSNAQKTNTPQSFNFDAFFDEKKNNNNPEILNQAGDLSAVVLTKAEAIRRPIKPGMTNSEVYTYIGNYNKTYILAEYKNSLLLIDQHAAHERVLYEQFAHRFESVATVTLMFPQMIACKKSDIYLLEPHLELFIKNGFTIERFDEQNLVVNATPVHVKNIAIDELIQETISWIQEYNTLPIEELYKKINHKLCAQMACKAAVKAGDNLTQEQMIELLSDLSGCDNRLTCPHGRPTLWSLDLYEIEKKFKRKI